MLISLILRLELPSYIAWSLDQLSEVYVDLFFKFIIANEDKNTSSISKHLGIYKKSLAKFPVLSSYQKSAFPHQKTSFVIA